MRRLLLTLGPLAAYAVLLKMLRLRDHPAGLSVFEGLWLLLPELLFNGGLLALAAALLVVVARIDRPRVLRGYFVGVQLLAVLAVAYHGVAHAFFETTGRSLDWSLAAFAIGRADETYSVVGSEMTALRWVQLLAVPAIVMIGPWFVRAGRAGPRIRARWLLLLGLALSTLSAVPRISRVDIGFAREPVFHAVAGILAPSNGAGGGGKVPKLPPRAQGPVRLTRSDPGAPASLVIILLESTRASATTPYNPPLKTTPFMQELAGASEVVERAYAVIPHTSKALIAVLCGIEPRTSFDVVEATPGAMPGRCIADLLAEQGYDTAYFQSATKKYEQRPGLVKNMGFEKLISGDDADKKGFVKANYFGYEDDILLAPTRKWLAERSDAPFFAAYLTNTPHHDYRVPKRYGRPRLAKPRRLNKYLQAVRYQDFFLKNLFDLYKEAGRYEQTVFILVGDHGQGFGEHGMWLHDDIMYDEGLRVPLLLHWPAGGITGRRIPKSLSHIDIAPTALDVLGFDIAEGGYAGVSWRSDEPPRAVHAACYRKLQCLAGVRGARKFIHYFGKRRDELFDLDQDPSEKNNLADANPDEVVGWRSELLGWRQAVHEMHLPFGENRRRQFVRSEPFSPKNSMSVRIGDSIELIGFDVPGGTVRRGKRFPVTLYFKALGSPASGHIDLRLTSPSGGKRGGIHVPALGLHPLEEWRAGENIRDVLKPRVPKSWRADEVGLCVRVTGADGQALPIRPGDWPEPVEDDCVRIATLRFRSKKGGG